MDREKFDQFPVLPLRDIVLFPSMIIPLYVGRLKSMNVITHSKGGKQILMVAQKSPSDNNPKTSGLYKVGVIANVLQVLTLEDSLKVLVEGIQRVKVLNYIEGNDMDFAEVRPMRTIKDTKSKEVIGLQRTILEQFEEYASINTKLNPDIILNIKSLEDNVKFSDVIASQLSLSVREKQQLLEQNNLVQKMELLLRFLNSEVETVATENKIKIRVKNQIDKNQKDYLLNEQLKAIYKELGEEDAKDELNMLEKKLKALKVSKSTRERVMSEFKKLKMMNPMSSEASVIRSYLDWVIDIPWGKMSKLNNNLIKAQETLDREHFGLNKIKERIIEYLAVHTRTRSLKSPILCLVGPPGVGKTSLARSVANATHREFAKISLGGLRDEAEIKGHRRTYIGAMPGKVIQSLKKAKKSNPVILLDEIDKLGNDFRGDPASAMLEVLDPEQNHIFNDHYMEVDIDLSNVMFIATANSYNIPRPLLDRMEIVELPGYTEEEKVQIAKSHLLPKQFKDHGIKDGELEIDEPAVRDIIKFYTKEAGLRNLNRKIASICRKVVREILVMNTKSQTKLKLPIIVTPSSLEKYLGAKKYNSYEINHDDLVGITNGLAYTEVGGDMLAIEAVKSYGKGDFQVTGKLGEVMKESVHAAISFIKSRAEKFGINPNTFKSLDLHVHVPEGAVPKDGPSAGVTMFTSLISVLTNTPVRKDVAMTGEITLRGKVLAIGGLKEKLLAAQRGGIKTVLIPKENEKDLKEIEPEIKSSLKIIGVEDVQEVLKHALVSVPSPIEWSLDAELQKIALRDEIKNNEITSQKH